MTEKTVKVIIQVICADEHKEIEQELELSNLEQGLASFEQALQIALGTMVVEVVETNLHAQIPKTWKNVGTAPRSLLTEFGQLNYRRHVYIDEQGTRRMPLDELMNVSKYERNNKKIDAMGASLATECSFRQASVLSSYALKTPVSASTIGRMVRRIGKKIQVAEAQMTWRDPIPGTCPAPVLYCEADGVYIHLQREKKPRAEIKAAIFYTGKRMIGHNRYCCENKVTTCQLDVSTRDWQVHLRELAYRHYDFESNKLAIVGRDEAQWVQNSFDALGLPTVHLLDRFHVVRCLKRAFGHVLNINELLDKLFSEGFLSIEESLRNAFDKKGTHLRKRQEEAYNYLCSHQDGLIDLDKRGLEVRSFSTLGAMEGNVDKLVRQRFRGRGMSWTIAGAQCMLAVMRHKKTYQNRSICLDETT